MSGSDTSTHHACAETAKAGVLRVIGNGSLGIAFQPIVDLASGEIIGYEALTRLADTETFANTGALFAAAERAGMLEELERASRTRTFELSRELPPGCLLFVNNSPEVFCHADFSSSIEALLARCPWLNPRRVVLEVTEQSAPASDSILDRHVLEMRERGYAVAIDDVGSGMNGLKRMMALRPNWLKLDIELIDDIENDPYKQSIIRFVVHFAKLCNMRIVAEGVERHEQLARLIELGVSHAQGFFIARPGSLTAPVREGLTATIRFLHEKAGMSRFHNPLTTTMRTLAEPATECPAGLAADDADRLLRESRNRPGLVLMEGPRFVGWLPAAAVREAMLHAEQRRIPVLRLCRADNLLVDPDLALADALEIASNRPDAEMLHPLVVADGENIVGVVTLRRLLNAAAASQGDAMRHVSPLTGMPNRVQADLWLGEHIERNDPADIAFIDLHHFEAYNAAYGFEFGDAMLKTLAGLIRSILVNVDDGAVFVSHLSEDRFLVAFHSDPRLRLQRLVQAFVEVRDQFFNAMDRAAGAYASVDGGGHRRVLPLSTVRALLIPKALLRVCTAGDLYEMERRMHDASRVDAGSTDADAAGLIIEPLSTTTIARRRSA